MEIDILSDKQYLAGTLNPEVRLGKGTIIEYVVLTTLEDCVKENFNHPFDLTSESLGELNVKSSSRRKSRNGNVWSFSKKPNSYLPDYYVCVGLDEEFKKILRVWFIPGDARVVGTHGINVIEKEHWLNKFKKYEVDPSPYNVIFQTLDITAFPEFCNVNVQDLALYRSIADDIYNMFMIEDIENKYGEGAYQKYLKWIDEKGLKKYHNLKGGVIGIYPHENFRATDIDNYPVFDYSGKYIGEMSYGEVFNEFVYLDEIDLQPFESRRRHILSVIRELAKEHKRVTLDQIRKESYADKFLSALNDLERRGDIIKVNETEYIVP